MSDVQASHSVLSPAWRLRVRRRLADDRTTLGALLLAPAILFVAALVGVPFVLAIVYSLTDVTVSSNTFRFIGLGNFERQLDSPAFWEAVRNTLTITLISQLIVVVLANVLALALARDFRGKWLIRLLILLPWVAPISLGAIGWMWLFDPIYSVLNWALRAVGWLGPGQRYIWLGDPNLAMASIIAVNVWRLLPFATVIILAGLGGIPKEILEAAAIDGAGPVRRTIFIIMPLILPITLVAALFGIVFSISDLVVVFVLTRGGPFNSTQVLASWAYYTGIDGGDLGGGAAIALFLFPVLVAVAALLLRLARKTDVI